MFYENSLARSGEKNIYGVSSAQPWNCMNVAQMLNPSPCECVGRTFLGTYPHGTEVTMAMTDGFNPHTFPGVITTTPAFSEGGGEPFYKKSAVQLNVDSLPKSGQSQHASCCACYTSHIWKFTLAPPLFAGKLFHPPANLCNICSSPNFHTILMLWKVWCGTSCHWAHTVFVVLPPTYNSPKKPQTCDRTKIWLLREFLYRFCHFEKWQKKGRHDLRRIQRWRWKIAWKYPHQPAQTESHLVPLNKTEQNRILTGLQVILSHKIKGLMQKLSYLLAFSP